MHIYVSGINVWNLLNLTPYLNFYRAELYLGMFPLKVPNYIAYKVGIHGLLI